MNIKKNIAQKFAPGKYAVKLGFAKTTHFAILAPIYGVLPPDLGDRLEFNCLNFCHANLGH